MPKFPLMIRRVNGDSMLPLLKQNDIVIGTRWFHPRRGDVVIAEAGDREIIKRIKKREGTKWWIEGDNPHVSTDSRTFGPLKRDTLKAKVIYPRFIRRIRPTRP